MEIFKLFGSILVDTDKAEESISKTDQKAEGLGKTLASGAKKAGEFGLAVAGGAVAAGTAMLAAANETASAADEIDKASIRMGISAESFQELQYAAEQSGVSVSDLEKAAKKLEGTDMNLDQAMEEIYSLGTAEERAAKAAELFGDSVAYNMAPMLEMSGQEMDDMRQRANDLGLVMSGEDVKAGVQFGDTMADITKSLKALKTQLGSAVMPLVQKFADMVLQFLPQIQSAMDAVIPVVIQLAEAVLPPLMDMIEQILPLLLNLLAQVMPFFSEIISAVMPVLIELLQTLLPPLMSIVEAILPVFITLLQTLSPILTLLMSLIKPILDAVLALIVPLVQLVSSLLSPLISLLGNLISTALKPLEPLIQTIGDLLGSVLGEAFKALQPIITAITDAFGGLISFITNVFAGNWEGAWEDIVGVFDSIFTGIIEIAKAPVNAIIKLLNVAIDGLNTIQIPDWVPLVGGKGLNIPKIPLLAKGGTVENEGLAIVGEEGPELINLPRGASVHPLSSPQIDYNKLGEAISNAISSKLALGDIVIPVYIGQERIEEIVIRSSQMNDYVMGGRA